MPKPRALNGDKNLISSRLIELRSEHKLSQRELARQLQLSGYNMDKNVITRIESNSRFVTDLELLTLSRFFHVSIDYLIGNTDESVENNM